MDSLIKIHLFLMLLCIAFVKCSPSRKLSSVQKTALQTVQQNPPNKTLQGTNAFMDISHFNENVDLARAQKAGIVGFFHKATQGKDFIDPQFVNRVKEGDKLGLLLGAYHFGTADSVEEQVDFFISALQNAGAKQIVPVLDWEPNPNHPQENSMSRKQAVQFIKLFKEKTGIYPTLYGGYAMFSNLGDAELTPDKDIFKQCPLWQGFYSGALGFLDGIWSDWTFQQYTDGTLGPLPHEVDGVGKVDRDTFNGTLAEASAFWLKNSVSEKLKTVVVQQPKERTWEFLKPGDVIDVIAPSSAPSNPEDVIKRIKEYFASKNLKVNIPDGLIMPTPVLEEANTVEKRVDFIVKAMLNPKSKAIWAIIGGGWGTEILDKLKERVDTMHIKTIKPIIGYSDVTAMHIFFNQYLNYPSLHGIELGANGDIEPAWNQSKIQPVLDVLMGVTPTLSYELEVISLGNMKPGQTLETELIGGNLLLVNAVFGSNNYSLNTQRKTLFIESIALGAGEVSRMLHGFRYGDILQKADALFLGNFVVQGGHPNPPEVNAQFNKVIQNVANNIKIPVFRSLDFGHGPVNNPLPLNTKATITIDTMGKKAIMKVSAN